MAMLIRYARRRAKYQKTLHELTPRGGFFIYESCCQSWPQESEQCDKWSFCLTAGKIGPRIRRDDEETSTPEPHPGFQGEGGACRRQGRSNTGAACGAVLRPPQSDHILESAACGGGARSNRPEGR